jgi:deoxyribonuclease-4
LRLGVHIRIAGGLVKALDRARELQCEAVQLFSGNPNSWKTSPLNLDRAAEFRRRCAE